jgi:hypothetical protein
VSDIAREEDIPGVFHNADELRDFLGPDGVEALTLLEAGASVAMDTDGLVRTGLPQRRRKCQEKA